MKNLGGLLRVTIKSLEIFVNTYEMRGVEDDDPARTAQVAKEMGELMYRIRQRAEYQLMERRVEGTFRLPLPKNVP